MGPRTAPFPASSTPQIVGYSPAHEYVPEAYMHYDSNRLSFSLLLEKNKRESSYPIIESPLYRSVGANSPFTLFIARPSGTCTDLFNKKFHVCHHSAPGCSPGKDAFG
jgi:uncharacterized protein (DUF608 family)